MSDTTAIAEKPVSAKTLYQREWARKNRDKVREYAKKAKERDPEKFKAADRNRGKRYRYAPGHREEYLARCREKTKAWRAANSEKAKAADIAYRKANPEKVKAFKERWRLGVTYGITPEQKAEMLALQGGVCKLCGTSDPGIKGWALDHCHKTQQIRGILCNHCNVGLGYFRDSPDLLERAIQYLRREICH